jgi:hypothetical protein
VRALLGDAGVVDHPAADGPLLLDDGQHTGADGGQERLVGPVGLGDEMVQRLMGGLDAPGLDAGRYGFDALASARQQQARAIRPERRDPVSVPERAAECLDIGAQASAAA